MTTEVNNGKLTIFSVTHLDCSFPKCDFIVPIQTNKDKTGIDLGILSDNTGNNISHKNANYSELTALYWIWQNLQNIDADFIGFCHYRRYFLYPTFFTKKLKNKFLNRAKKFILRRKIFQKLKLSLAGSHKLRNFLLEQLNKGYVIISDGFFLFDKYHQPISLKNDYSWVHSANDWQICKSVVTDLFPDYIESFNYCEAQNYYSPYNVFIARKDFVMQYCNWLFPILFNIEKRVEIPENKYQARVLAFLAERLFNIYLYKNNIKKIELPIFNPL